MLEKFESKPPREKEPGDSRRDIEDLTAALERGLQVQTKELSKREFEADLKRWQDHLISLEKGLQESLQKIKDVGDGIGDPQQLIELKERSEVFYKSRIGEVEQKIASIRSELEHLGSID